MNGVISDDEDLASIAETSERDFMALQETPFTCQPYQVEMSETGYRDRHNRLGTGGWVINHYKWIVWVLESLERRLGRYSSPPPS